LKGKETGINEGRLSECLDFIGRLKRSTIILPPKDQTASTKSYHIEVIKIFPEELQGQDISLNRHYVVCGCIDNVCRILPFVPRC
jgi:hypothetical protein